MQAIRQFSTVRSLCSVAVLALAVMAGPVLAQKAERPSVKVGDQWRYEVRLGPVGVKSSDIVRVITSVTPSRIEGTENGVALVLTPELNNVESPRSKNSDQRLLNFPLTVGKQWKFTDDYEFTFEEVPGRGNFSAKVVGYEKVRVPAGEFDAFKLEAKGKWVTGGASGEASWTYWYAAAARAIVKMELRWSKDVSRHSTRELAEFKLQP
jgi:hypothetical protein